MIDVYNNFLSGEDHSRVLSYCMSAAYFYGETDNPDTPPTGMTHEIMQKTSIHKLLHDKTQSLVHGELRLYRMYINCFAPRELTHFHTDGDRGITFLYYPQNDWKPDDGGETQIYVGEDLQGLVPKPNRLIMFDAHLLHRATPFRNRHRFTIAVKYR